MCGAAGHWTSSWARSSLSFFRKGIHSLLWSLTWRLPVTMFKGTAMSAAAAQYSRFKEQVVRNGRVYTFTDNGEYPVFPVAGREVIPCWSSRRRMEAIQRAFPKYSGYEISEMSLADFRQWLP